MTHLVTTAPVIEVKHPLVQHKLGLLRDVSTTTDMFRRLVNALTLLLTYEATKELATEEVEIETPLERVVAARISGKKVAVCPILRAGMGMLDGVLSLIAAPEGIDRLHAEHPDVTIVVAAVDRELNERGYIMPGLGDAGDRLYGTK